MKKPSTLEQFVQTICNMDHRERLVFPCSTEVMNKFEDVYADTIEVYVTHLDVRNRAHLVPNVNIKLSTCDGKLCTRDGNAIVNKSKYLERCNMEFFAVVYDMIAAPGEVRTYESTKKYIEENGSSTFNTILHASNLLSA
jgi:hypothetical protein